MPTRLRFSPLLALLVTAPAPGCSDDTTSRAQRDPASAPQAGFGGSAPNAPTGQRCVRECSDFPAEPIFDRAGPTQPPANAPKLFGSPDRFTTPGACVSEPALADGTARGALLPRNWLRPRFRFTPLPGETLWEIRLANRQELHDLVVYTTRTTWELPAEIWRSLATNVLDSPIEVTIRGLDAQAPGEPSGTQGTFMIAPVDAPGKLVYWATNSSQVRPDTSKLAGFAVGDEGVVDVLTVPQVGDRGILAAGGRDLRGKNGDGQGVPPGHVQCIGCHVSTPDGAAVAFTDHWPWNNVLASVEEGVAGQRPAYMTEGAELLLNQPWLGMQTVSAAHFRPGDRIVVSAYSPRNAERVGFADAAPYPSRQDTLVWFDLETRATFDASAAALGGDVQQALNQAIAAQLGNAFGFLTLEGETRSVAAPSWSHDGTKIAYTSADVTEGGGIGRGNSEVDLHVVPWNDRKGGRVAKIRGAAEPSVAEYYPAFSADDRLIAFNRVARIDDAAMYYRPDGEVWVVAAEGGTPVRLAANDPPACTGERSPGVINSWPKWSPRAVQIDPEAQEFAGDPRTYYWLIFASARAYPGQFYVPPTQYSPPDTRSSQLYMTAVVRNERTSALETFGAVYLWNQDPDTNNITPAWDEFKIPPVPGPD
jgi:hypothetical protein